MKYIKLYEGFKSTNAINWAMIEDIKDMSLEYLDEGLLLYMYINSSVEKSFFAYPKYHSIYGLQYSHHGFVGYWRYKDNGKDRWSDLDDFGHIFYSVFLYGYSDEELYSKESKELVSRIKEAYPNETILYTLPKNKSY